MASIYEGVLALKPRRSAFNLSYSKAFTCDLGQLIPVACDEMVPGDTFVMGAEVVVRFQPMVTPILHPVNVTLHTFFVPYRLLDEDFEAFITGGEDGQDASTLDRWTPTGGNVTNDDGTVVADNAVGSLWDFFGFPTGIVPTGATPLAFPRAAYNLVWNFFYRDENLQTELALTSSVVKNRSWQKDYFTSALENQQKGTAPALPLSGTSSAVWATGSFVNEANSTVVGVRSATALLPQIQSNGNANARTNLENMFNNNTVDLSYATTFDVADLRLAFQVQKWMERNARGGSRYTEFLQSHFGVGGNLDARLQRPEYIGGMRMPVIVSEVLQTSETDTTPQGTMAGHGLSAQADGIGKYTAQEFGCVITIMSIMPEPAYFQGIDRQWLRTTKYDFYSPEWAHLSEQAVIRAELYATAVANDNTTVFGYQGRYNEMRSKKNMVCSLMRPGVGSSLGDYWNMVREFAAAPELNETFIRCVPRKEWLAVPAEPACIVHVANKIKAIRPMPIEAAPGLIDHA